MNTDQAGGRSLHPGRRPEPAGLRAVEEDRPALLLVHPARPDRKRLQRRRPPSTTKNYQDFSADLQVRAVTTGRSPRGSACPLRDAPNPEGLVPRRRTSRRGPASLPRLSWPSSSGALVATGSGCIGDYAGISGMGAGAGLEPRPGAHGPRGRCGTTLRPTRWRGWCSTTARSPACSRSWPEQQTTALDGARRASRSLVCRTRPSSRSTRSRPKARGRAPASTRTAGPPRSRSQTRSATRCSSSRWSIGRSSAARSACTTRPSSAAARWISSTTTPCASPPSDRYLCARSPAEIAASAAPHRVGARGERPRDGGARRGRALRRPRRPRDHALQPRGRAHPDPSAR